MNNKDSVKKLQLLKFIYKVFWIIILACIFVVGVITLIDAAQKPDVKGTIVVAGVFGLIFGIALMVLLGYIGLCLIDYFINKRQENIEYMSARIDHIKNSKETVKRVVAAKAIATKTLKKKKK